MSKPSANGATAADMTAAGTDVDFAGRTWTIYPLTLDDLGSLERYIRAEMIRTVRASLDGATAKEKAAEMAGAYRHAATITFDSEEGDAMLNTASGIKQLLYHSIRHGEPGFSMTVLDDLNVSAMEGVAEACQEIQRMTQPPEQPQAAGSAEGKARAPKAKPKG